MQAIMQNIGFDNWSVVPRTECESMGIGLGIVVQELPQHLQGFPSFSIVQQDRAVSRRVLAWPDVSLRALIRCFIHTDRARSEINIIQSQGEQFTATQVGSGCQDKVGEVLLLVFVFRRRTIAGLSTTREFLSC